MPMKSINAQFNTDMHVQELASTSKEVDRMKCILDAKLDTMQPTPPTPATGPIAHHSQGIVQGGTQLSSITEQQGATSRSLNRAGQTSIQATAQSLQQDSMLQALVGSRMKDLIDKLDDSDTDTEGEDGEPMRKRSKGKKNKSGRNITSEYKVLKKVDWPHFYIYKGQNRKAAEFDKLTLAEFVNGCLAIVQKCKNDTMRESMITHLREMMQDTVVYGFESVREYHGIVLEEMEQKRLTWGDRDAIQELRRQYAQTSRSTKQEVKSSSPSARTIQTCTSWNSGLCRERGDHDGYAHLCSFCTKLGFKRRHTEKECKQKSKNGAATYAR